MTGIQWRSSAPRWCVVVGFSVAVSALARIDVAAQQLAPLQAPAQRTPQAAAPSDLTGYWVSVVTEDWIFRMVTPPKGDYAGVPLSPAGRLAADVWDPAKDAATGNQCKAYGAAGLMRMPTRLHITWENETTLKIETDAGQQVRRLFFNKAQPASAERQWSGRSVAEWQIPPAAGRGGGGEEGGEGPAAGRGAAGPAPTRAGTLKVVTTYMRPGYLRTNGVPYSDETVLTEYLDRTPAEANGDVWLIVFSVVEDPKYLTQPFITSSHFKREADGSKWNPTACEVARPPR